MAAAQRNRNRPMFDALQVNPNVNDWTVLVQCLPKSKLKVSQYGSDYRNYLFCDTQGTLISVMTYDQAVAKFNRLLQPYKRYYISNAAVKVAKPQYQIGEYQYTWTLYGRTPVDLLHEPVPPSIPIAFNFIKFEDMYMHADVERGIAIKVLVVASATVPHPTYDSVRDYIIVNKEKRMMLLRLWDDTLDNDEFNVSARLPEPTVIVGGNLKITTHHGLSVSTKRNSFFLRDPPLEEDDSLLDWYAENAEGLKKLVDEKAHIDTYRLLPPPNDTLLVRLEDFVSNIAGTKAAWVAATMHMLPAQEKLWYSACEHCGKSFTAPVGFETSCTACGRETKLQPRCHIGVFLNDETKTITAMLFSPEAEKLTGFTGFQLKEAADKGTPLIDAVGAKLHKKPVICFVKGIDRQYRGNIEINYPIVKLYTQEEIASFRDSSVVQAATPTNVTAQTVGAPAVLNKEHQFFSPKTKLAIEEIANTSTDLARTSAAHISPKRGLVFATECPDKIASDAPSDISEPNAAETSCSTGSDIMQNPGKKVKGREEEV